MTINLHLADYHLGVGSDTPLDPIARLPIRVADFLSSLDSVVDFAYAEGVDMVTIAGDIYHRHSPSPTLQRELATRVSKLAKLCPVVILPGNHDMPGGLDKASAVDIFASLDVPNVHVLSHYGVVIINDRRGDPVQIAPYPYPFVHHILGPKEAKGGYKARARDLLDLAASSLVKDAPALLLGHFSIDTASYGSEQGMSIGDAAELSLGDIEAGPWDYVALGHIHLYQSLSAKMPVIYPGSLDRVDFTEENDDKGFILVDLDHSGDWERIAVDVRPFRTVRANLRTTRHPTDKLLKIINNMELEGAVVRLVLDTPADGLATLNMTSVHDAVRKLGAAYIASISTNPERTVRELDTGGQAITSMAPRQQLNLYFQSMGFDADKTKALNKLAKRIMAEVDNG